MLEIRARNRASDLDQCGNLQSFDLPGREAHWCGCSSDNIGNIDRQWMAVDRAPFMPWRMWRSRVWARELRLNARLLRQNTDDGEADIVADLPIAAATRCRNEEGATIGSCFTCRLTNREALVDDGNIKCQFGLDADLESILEANQKDIPPLGLGIGYPFRSVFAPERLEKGRAQFSLAAKGVPGFLSLPHGPSLVRT